MKSVRLVGGLGNQFFQLLAACKIFPVPHDLKLNTAYLQRYAVGRDFLLPALFDLDRMGFSVVPIPTIPHSLRLGRLPGRFSANDRNIGSVSSSVRWVDGYFQDHWSEVSIKEVLHHLEEFKIHRPDSEPSLSIHVRGSDFVGSAFNVVNRQWYDDALSCLDVSEFEEVRLITDDRDYAMNLLPDSIHRAGRLTFGAGTVVSDFLEISSSRVIIGGSSTFVLAAFLYNCNKIEKFISPGTFGLGRPRGFRFANEVFVPCAS